MNIISIGVYIVVIFCIVKLINGKLKEESNKTKGETPTYGKPSNGYGNTYADTRNTTSTSTPNPYTSKPNPYTTSPSRQAAKAVVKTDGITGKASEKTTMEYLADKAEKIEQEQETQKRESDKTYSESVGAKGTIAAARAVDGASIPPDRRPIKCHYCGADNIVPTSAHANYTCYFCREVL